MTIATFDIGPRAPRDCGEREDFAAAQDMMPRSGRLPLLEDSAVARNAEPLAWIAYREHFVAVWRTLRRLGVNESDVDDAVQDVFLTVQRRAQEFLGQSQLKTWVLGIAVRVALNARRGAQRRRLRFAELPEEPACHGPAPDELAAEREAIELVHELLERLAPEQRVLLVLVDLEQLTVLDAAQLLGLNSSTAYKRLEVARTRFSGELERAQKRDQWKLDSWRSR